MGKCIVCGKKELFLKVDNTGRCNECTKQIEKEETQKFELYYANLLQILQEINESVYVGNDPIKALEFIPNFTDKIEKCDILKSKIHEEKYATRLYDRLINNIEYQDEFSERHGMGHLKDWGISVFTDAISKKYSEKIIFSRLDESII